jgi:hypothetical protein
MDMSSQSLIDEERVESELKGNTLRVYWHLLRAQGGSVGVRQTQKALGFSSPTLASYHLRKLEDIGLVREERGEYHLIREVRVGVLRQFTKLGSVMLPRYTLHATMLSTLLVTSCSCSGRSTCTTYSPYCSALSPLEYYALRP